MYLEIDIPDIRLILLDHLTYFVNIQGVFNVVGIVDRGDFHVFRGKIAPFIYFWGLKRLIALSPCLFWCWFWMKDMLFAEAVEKKKSNQNRLQCLNKWCCFIDQDLHINLFTLAAVLDCSFELFDHLPSRFDSHRLCCLTVCRRAFNSLSTIGLLN